MASLLQFWGGALNGFWAFDHNPIDYANAIKCPTLLLYGALDKNITIAETKEIYKNLAGKKTLKIYEHAGHENYLLQYKNEWTIDVLHFLQQN
jgi:alpha-beta hydrolase superfamily lysophospholipase